MTLEYNGLMATRVVIKSWRNLSNNFLSWHGVTPQNTQKRGGMMSLLNLTREQARLTQKWSTYSEGISKPWWKYGLFLLHVRENVDLNMLVIIWIIASFYFVHLCMQISLLWKFPLYSFSKLVQYNTHIAQYLTK